MKSIVFCTLLFITTWCEAQTYYVAKNPLCIFTELVVLREIGGSSEPIGTIGCLIKPVVFLPDSVKIDLIEKLFQYLDDTTTVTRQVHLLTGHYTPQGHVPKSNTYNIQVNALVLMNYIAFSAEAQIYNPYPILYDKKDSTEITTNGSALQFVIQAYRNWFKGIKRKGFKNYRFPLVDDRYEWFAGKINRRVVKAYPVWSSFYDCLTIEEITSEINLE